jgi:Protein of unknown function (DUF1573)
MKKYVMALFMVVGVCQANAQVAPAVAKPTTTSVAGISPASFSTTTHSFGKLKKGIPQSYSFALKNNSNKPLIIENATAECGCTTPEYSKAPIMKGKSSAIKVTYNAANPGSFSKKVTVKFLNVDQPTILVISGEVVDAAAPKK